MKIESKASQVLARAESDLRGLIVEAAGNGEYHTVELIAAWARQLTLMRQEGAEGPPSTDFVRSESPSSARASAQKSSQRKPAKKRKRRVASGYPKFVRSGDSLVKIAWSKSQKGEYKHKSPHYVLTQLVNSLSELLSGDSIVVSMENVLPLKTSDGTEIPDYQAYLCLAWLRNIGAVKQKGREGYTRSGDTGELQGFVRSSWERLPEDK